MLKSVVVVAGTYLLSIVLVILHRPATIAPLPWRLRIRPYPHRHGSHRQHGPLRRGFDTLRVALRPLCAEPPFAARAMVLRHRRGDGYWSDHSKLEQRMASLVLVILAAKLAGELLDRFAAGQSQDRKVTGRRTCFSTPTSPHTTACPASTGDRLGLRPSSSGRANPCRSFPPGCGRHNKPAARTPDGRTP